MTASASGSPAASLAAFHLVGDRTGLPAEQTDCKPLRPALFAGYRDLSRLRYEFPLILVDGQDDVWARSLADTIDLALQKVAPPGIEGEQTRRQVLSLEQEIRNLVAHGQTGSLTQLWDKARQKLLSRANEPLAARLLENLAKACPGPGFDGAVIDCDVRLPFRLIRHTWHQCQQVKAMQLHARISHLVSRLADILRADYMHSEEARSAGHLERSLGTGDHAVFDFQAMARILKSLPVGQPMPEKRRQRIHAAISVLESQRFVNSSGAGTLFCFAYNDCNEALAAFRQRLPEMAALVRAISIAELEIENRYDASQHDVFYHAFDEDHLGPGDLALFPSYLVCVEDGDDDASVQSVLELLRTGLPFKIVAMADNITGELATAAGQLCFGTRGQQLAGMAMGLNNVFVMQSAASSLYRLREFVMSGLSSDRPALFRVYAGALGGQAPYLVAAAATESRIFPGFIYDPASGSDLASRFHLDGNPGIEHDWTRHTFQYEDATHQTKSEKIAFTPVDFMACDQRFASYFASVPVEQWGDDMVPVDAFLQMDPNGRHGKVPFVLLIDENEVLHRAVCDDKLIDAAQRCREYWHGLQELGGIKNSHALRALAGAREAWEKEKEQLVAQASIPPASEDTAAVQAGDPAAKAVTGAPANTTPAMEPATEAASPEAAAITSDDPWIETIRCTTCNECTELNGLMFAYDDDKRAYIADPEAGTYRELVEAAETCQVAIIHPGQPSNPDEPGLQELLERAQPFNG